MACCNCDSSVNQEAKEIVAAIGTEPEFAIPLLQEIQRRHSYLPEDLMEAVAVESGIPASRLFGVATFYSQFRFTPQGKHLIRICKGTACHVAGAEMLSSSISDDLGIAEGETTEDLMFSLESVACLGCCSLAPVVMIDDEIYGKLSPKKIKEILKGYKNGEA